MTNDRGEVNYEYRIPDGNEGIQHTLYIMRNVVRNESDAPEVVQFARQLTLNVPEKDWRRKILTVFHFVRDRIRYTLDPLRTEYLATPQRVLDMRSGDCDEKAILLASLLDAIGIPVRFKAVGFEGAELSHVYVEAKYDDRWIALDATEKYPAGWQPPDIKNRFIVNV